MIGGDDYRAMMRNLASGVPVVTTVVDGQFYGATATSFTSVSLDPPLVQVTFDLSSNTRALIESSGVFAVNVLGADQEQIARDFSQKGIDRFQNCSVKVGRSGLPLIDGAIAILECRVTDKFPGGDHTIYIGEVEHGDWTQGSPLIYFQGDYGRLAQKEDDR